MAKGSKGCQTGQKVVIFGDFWSFWDPFFDPFVPFHILTGLTKPVKMGLLKCVNISNLNTPF
jgi:hypothetical protein